MRVEVDATVGKTGCLSTEVQVTTVDGVDLVSHQCECERDRISGLLGYLLTGVVIVAFVRLHWQVASKIESVGRRWRER